MRKRKKRNVKINVRNSIKRGKNNKNSVQLWSLREYRVCFFLLPFHCFFLRDFVKFKNKLRTIEPQFLNVERMWNEMDALPAAPTFSFIFFFFFLVFYIFLYTMNQKAVEKQRISSMCFLGNNFELKIQPISKVIGHSISMSRENGWRRAMDLLPISEGGWT